MNENKNWITGICLICLTLLGSFGQANCQYGTQFFSTLSMRDGLPTNIISSISQDQYGFIWIGTGNGLARYDGYKFKVFQRNQSNKSLPSNEINSVVANHEFVWIGTWEGLCKIDIRSFEVTRIDLGLKSPVRTLLVGKDDILWVGTADGLIKYSIKSDTYQRFDKERNNLSHNMVRAVYEDSDGHLWVGTYNRLNFMSAADSLFTVIHSLDPLPPAFSNHLILDINTVHSNSDSLLWVGTELGLYQLNRHTFSFSKYKNKEISLSNEVIKCIYTDTDRNLWLGTDFGLNTINIGDNQYQAYFHNPQLAYSIANNVIRQIFEDRGGVIWIVTSNGLSRINRSGNFYTYHEISTETKNQLIGNQLRTILVSKTGLYWLATQHGVIRLDPRNGERIIFDTRAPANRRILLDNVFALEEDKLGRIWIGTAGGINIWNDQTSEMHTITADDHNGLNSNYIGKFSISPDGTIWVSAWEGGIYRVKGDYNQINDIAFEPIPSFDMGSEKHVYGDGNLWVVEYNELYRVDAGTLIKTHIKSFSDAVARKMIYSIYFSNKGEFWAGTNTGLLHYIPDNDQTHFHQINTNSNDIITSIIEDEHGNIWSTTNTSLLKFYPENGTSEFFPLDNNLPLKSFYYGCATKTADGEIIFGGDNGFVTFSPQKAITNTYLPPVYITNLEVNNSSITVNEDMGGILLERDIPFIDHLTFKFTQRSVAFEFSALHFWQPSTNVYAYKLEGFDDEWTYASGAKNFAVYSNLPADDYAFLVKGTNNYGKESDKTARLTFMVKPPLLLNNFFIAIYVLLAILIIYYSLKFYAGRVRLKNELMIARLEKEHAEEIEHTKEHFFTNISHELRTPISLILPPIHEIQKRKNLDEQGKILIDLAERNSLRLLRLVNQILDFNKLENDTLHLRVTSVEMVNFCKEVFSLFEDNAKRHHISFEFESKKTTGRAWVDMEKIETVLFNLLSNAFKFTPNDGSIKLSLDFIENEDALSEGTFVMKIIDNGIGIPHEDQPKIFERFYQSKNSKSGDTGSGIGLTLAAEYVNLHHGVIDVKSQVGAGTTFIVKLPLGKKHFPLDSITHDAPVSLMATRSVHEARKGLQPYQFNLKSDKPLILVIEDNPEMVEFIRSSLSSRYNIVTAENGEEGLIKANNFLPEVIISDIMMPVMDGLTLCKKVKESPRTSYVGIILLTAKSLDFQKLEGIRSGADVYLTKPFDIDLLEAHVDQLIARKKELTDYFRSALINHQDQPKTENNQDNKFVKQVMDIIEANISNPELTVEMISDEMAMSSTHLYRKLKMLTEYTAKTIIQKYRLKKASLLLKNKEGNISEIMYQVGFSNLSYFSKCFKAEYGVTPKVYQNSKSRQFLLNQ